MSISSATVVPSTTGISPSDTSNTSVESDLVDLSRLVSQGNKRPDGTVTLGKVLGHSLLYITGGKIICNNRGCDASLVVPNMDECKKSVFAGIFSSACPKKHSGSI